MENSQEETEVEYVPLTINEDIRSYLYRSVRWTYFLSIVGFMLTGLILLSTLSIPAFLSGNSGTPQLAALSSGSLTAAILLYSLLVFYPSFLLNRFSAATKKAVLYGDQEALTEAMRKLHSYFKFFGICTFAALAFYIVAIVFSVVK